MSIDSITTEEAKQELAATIAKLLKGERDSAAANKSRERMDHMREEIRNRVGTVEVAVDYIRDARDK